jgi:hypothetical protein
MSDGGNIKPRSAKLAASAGLSPYGRAGAPGPHPNTDPYESLRARALSTLEAMGFDPDTMVEHPVLWAEHQDPFGHVMNAQFVSFMGASWIRVMESYDEFLSAEELAGVMNGKTVAPMVRRFDLEIKRQVKYPDVVRDSSLHVPPSGHPTAKSTNKSLSPTGHCRLSAGKD